MKNIQIRPSELKAVEIAFGAADGAYDATENKAKKGYPLLIDDNSQAKSQHFIAFEEDETQLNGYFLHIVRLVNRRAYGRLKKLISHNEDYYTTSQSWWPLQAMSFWSMIVFWSGTRLATRRYLSATSSQTLQFGGFDYRPPHSVAVGLFHAQKILGWVRAKSRFHRRNKLANSMRRIVCAAIRFPSGEIICSARHADRLMHDTVKAYGKVFREGEQGFIDQFCKFLTREEALVVAKEANQIVRRCGGDDVRLYSENLY